MAESSELPEAIEEERLSAPSSPEPEELEDIDSPGLEADSEYEDAPSRLEESSFDHDNNISTDHSNQVLCNQDEYAGNKHEGIPYASGPLSPSFGDDTIYASANETLLSEPEVPGGQDLEHGIGYNPKGLPTGKANEHSVECKDQEDNFDSNEELEEGEEGELKAEETQVKDSVYQTEPVSSDDDLYGGEESDANDDVDTKSKTDINQQGYNVERTVSRIPGINRTVSDKPQNDLISHEDHVELDYEEDLDDGEKLRADHRLEDDDKDDGAGEDGACTSESDEEVQKNGRDEDCEEGEIVDDEDFRQDQRRLCRFFSRGNCTWGVDCRFLHPGVNDKGNYTLIEKPLGPPSMAGRLGPQPWHRPQDKPQEDEEFDQQEQEPAPPSPPREETAWERGLRHAKEMRKLAKQRKEQETNFEEKKMNLSLEDVENKENHREINRIEKTPTKVYLRDPYYDNAYDSEEDYYKDEPWHDGHFQNFEVRYTRDSEDYLPEDYRPQRGERERLREKTYYRERRTSPPPAEYRYSRGHREGKYPEKRHDIKYKEPPPPSAPQKPTPKPDIIRREPTSSKITRGDEWHDPWQRTNKEMPKKRPVPSMSRSRSRSRGRRRRRSSISSSSSYSSRSRSSSYSSRSSYSSSSSYSSRSSRSSSSSRSRSPPPRRPPLSRGPQGPNTTPSNAAAAGVLRRAPPIVGRGITASTKSSGGSSKPSATRNAPAPTSKPVARVPVVARVPSVNSSQKESIDGKGQPSKTSGGKQQVDATEKKSQKSDLSVQGSTAHKAQTRDTQKRTMGAKPVSESGNSGMLSAKSTNAQAKPGSRAPVKSGPNSSNEDKGTRKPGRGIPTRMKRHPSSSSSSRSRSRSFSSSSSRSSSGSSRSSSSSGSSSSGSADSDNLYRGVGKTSRRKVSPSPRRKVPVSNEKLRKPPSMPGPDRSKARGPDVSKSPDRRKQDMDKPRERDKKAPPKQVIDKPVQRDRSKQAVSDSRIRSAVSSSSGLAPAKQMAKDPLKVSGQKQSIKLTLSNKDKPPEKNTNASAPKKRPAPDAEAPATKRVTRSPAKETRTVTKGPPPKSAEKPTKSRPESNKSPPAAKKPTESPTKVVKPAPVTKSKKSMSSRREELLKQLKAVEDAIARKRAKMS